MSITAALINKAKIKYKCEKGKHDWDYCIRGNAMVDNLNDTYSMWEIPSRWCKTCKRNEVGLGNGWELDNGHITINDLKVEK